MKISYAQVFQAAPVITNIANKILSAGLALKLLDIIDQLNPTLVEIEKYRETVFANASETESQAELTEKFAAFLNNNTIDVTFPLLAVAETDGAGLSFSIREMAAIRFLFERPQPR
jgi:hypothetical protein